LHAQGCIEFVDPDHPSWLIRRADDKSTVLTRDESRVLSLIPAQRAAEVSRLTAARTLARCEAKHIVDKLVEGGLVEVVPSGAPAVRLTAAGLDHPQRIPAKRIAPPPRLPVRSDRVRLVLQTIAGADALRIRDVKRLTNIPRTPSTP
ncbi:MAG TPA: hypothetical protein VEH77_04160, partial [Roseiarcus sp.]|nr:hypothetical protein [Roseiarcus sp.]